MQLYSAVISPYAARCRIQIQHKELPVDIVPPPGGMRSAEVLAANPTGRIPVLMTPEGPLAESWAIMEYLEATYPTPAMRPSQPLAAARQTEVVRFADQYLAPAMFPLFRALRGSADEAAVAQAIKDQSAQTALLNQMLPKAATPELPLSLADAALVPVVWYGWVLGRHFGGPKDLSQWPEVAAWWERTQSVTAARDTVQELETGLKAAIPPLFA